MMTRISSIRRSLQLVSAVATGIFLGLLFSQSLLHGKSVASSQHSLDLPSSIMVNEATRSSTQLIQSMKLKKTSRQQQNMTQHQQKDDAVAAPNPSHSHNNSMILKHQVDLQNEFQSLIRKQQFPVNCSASRLLLTVNQTAAKPADGFAREVQDMGRWLQVGMATQRCLVIRDSWKSAYQPPSCNNNASSTRNATSSSWPCLWKPLSGCREVDNSSSNETLEGNLSATLAIDPSLSNTFYFDTYLYGPKRVQEARKWPWGVNAHVDIVPRWERAMGRFWIRAQLSHFLWRPSPWLRQQIQARLVEIDPQQRYIGMHIRFTDNRNALRNDFGRKPEITRDFKNFMAYASRIRDAHPDVSTIYLPTDNDKMIEETKRRIYRKKWNITVQHNVARGTSLRHMWFKELRSEGAAAIAADLEVLRKADFLVGSHQSNVYRLACQLNTAFHVAKYSYDMDRQFSVDVEWFEDP